LHKFPDVPELQDVVISQRFWHKDFENFLKSICDEGECSRLACRVKWGARTDAVRCW